MKNIILGRRDGDPAARRAGIHPAPAPAAPGGAGLRKVEPYRRKMEAAGIKPEDIRTLADLQKLPFTNKDDLRDNYPFGLFTVPLEEVVRIHASSGTTGKPTVVGYTKKDIETWAEAHGPGPDLRRGPQGRYGPQCLRLRPVHRRPGRPLRRRAPRGHGHSGVRRQHQAADHHHAGFRLDRAAVHPLLCPQSRRCHGRDGGRSRPACRCGSASSGPSPGARTCARRSSSKLNIKAVDIYGLSEVIGPGVAMECLQTERRHAHLRGPFPAGDHRSGDRSRSCRRARRANWSSPP